MPDGADGRKQLHLRLDGDLYGRLAEAAAERGVTVTAAAAAAIERGLSERPTAPERDERLAGAIEELSGQVAQARSDMASALGEMGVARKNIGKSTRASYGSLAMLSWLYVDLVRFLDAANFDDPRVRAWASGISPADAFRLFEAGGGALQADPGTDLYRALELARRREPFASMGTEALFGVDEGEWSGLCGADDDASAIRAARRPRGGRGGR